jgi:hypothetical protein
MFFISPLFLCDIIFKNKNAVTMLDERMVTAIKNDTTKIYCRFPTLVLSRSGGSGAKSAFKGMFSVSRGVSAE